MWDGIDFEASVSVRMDDRFVWLDGGCFRYRRLDRCAGQAIQRSASAGISPDDIVMDDGAHPGLGGIGQRTGVLASSGLPVMVKTVRYSDRGTAETAMAEVRDLVRAEVSPYVLQCLAGFLHARASRISMVSELMDCGSLADFRQRLGAGISIPPKHVACITLQMLQGLDCLQARGLARSAEIEPSHVLLNSRGDVKLKPYLHAGFGDRMEQRRSADFRCYMAPERALGDEHGPLADIWSVGIVVHEMANGAQAFEAVDGFPELFDALVEQPEPRLDASAHPPLICDFVAACLAREVGSRPGVAELLAHEFLEQAIEIKDQLGCWVASFSSSRDLDLLVQLEALPGEGGCSILHCTGLGGDELATLEVQQGMKIEDVRKELSPAVGVVCNRLLLVLPDGRLLANSENGLAVSDVV